MLKNIRSFAAFRLISLSFAACFLLNATLPAQTPPTDREAEQFADKLLARMTLAEKIGQMEQASDKDLLPAVSEEFARGGKVGSYLFVKDIARINRLQKLATEESRLHIPLLLGYDVIHGYDTIFPIPLALASSWNPQVAEAVQAQAAREARANGIHWAFTPMVDIARDARWGRIMEGAGEDPYLGEQMAAAQVRGLQGPYIGAPDHILACVKHFGGYGAVEGGRDYDAADIPETLLHNVYLRPYQAAVAAGTASVMSAYQDVNDVPATGNVWLMQDVLRKQWGFQGFVVSDWDAVASLKVHGYAADNYDAAVRAVRAGINMEMTSHVYRDHLEEAVKKADVTVAQIDDLVRPLLVMKYKLGLFKNPYVEAAKATQANATPAALQVARQAAEESAVLLKNSDQTLPLSKSLKHIALIGPMVDSKLDTIGSWAIHADRSHIVTIAQGLRDKLPNAQIDVTTGVELQRAQPSIFDDQFPPQPVTLKTDEARTQEFQHAVQLAKGAEVTILVMGESQNMNGEHASRASLELPGDQLALMQAIVATGKPVVLVLLTGRPLDLNWANEHVPAVLNAWYPGVEGGHAVANLLFGDANPSGHLTVSWPRSAGQEPLYYNHNLTQFPEDDQRYWDSLSTPLYPFGYGLSYSNFTVQNLHLSADSMPESETLTATVAVKNNGKQDGEEVVQLYTHQRAGSASRPVRELKAFTKVAVKAGETKTVTLTLSAKTLTYWSGSLHHDVLEPGNFDVWVGDSSAATEHAVFSLTK